MFEDQVLDLDAFRKLREDRKQQLIPPSGSAPDPESQNDENNTLLLMRCTWEFMRTLVPARQEDGTVSLTNRSIQLMADQRISDINLLFTARGFYPPRHEDITSVDFIEHLYPLFSKVVPHSPAFTVDSFESVTDQLVKYVLSNQEAKKVMGRKQVPFGSPESIPTLLELPQDQMTMTYAVLMGSEYFADVVKALSSKFGGDPYQQLSRLQRNLVKQNAFIHIKNAFEHWEKDGRITPKNIALLAKGFSGYLGDALKSLEAAGDVNHRQYSFFRDIYNRMCQMYSDNTFDVDAIDFDDVDLKAWKQGGYEDSNGERIDTSEYFQAKYQLDYYASKRLAARVGEHIHQIAYNEWLQSDEFALKRQLSESILSEMKGLGAHIEMPDDADKNDIIVKMTYGPYHCSVYFAESYSGLERTWGKTKIPISERNPELYIDEFEKNAGSLPPVLNAIKSWLDSVYVGIDFEKAAAFKPNRDDIGEYEYTKLIRSYLKQAVEQGIIPSTVKFTVAKDGYRDARVKISELPQGMLCDNHKLAMANITKDYEEQQKFYNARTSRYSKEYAVLHHLLDSIAGCERVCTDDGDNGNYPVLHNYQYDILISDRLDAKLLEEHKRLMDLGAKPAPFMFTPNQFERTPSVVNHDQITLNEKQFLTAEQAQELSVKLSKRADLVSDGAMLLEKKQALIGGDLALVEQLLKHKLPKKNPESCYDILTNLKGELAAIQDHLTLMQVNDHWLANTIHRDYLDINGFGWSKNGSEFKLEHRLGARNQSGIPYVVNSVFSTQMNTASNSWSADLLQNKFVPASPYPTGIKDYTVEQLIAIKSFTQLGIMHKGLKEEIPATYAECLLTAKKTLSSYLMGYFKEMDTRYANAVKVVLNKKFDHGVITEPQLLVLVAMAMKKQLIPLRHGEFNIVMDNQGVDRDGRIYEVDREDPNAVPLFSQQELEAIINEQPSPVINAGMLGAINSIGRAHDKRLKIMLLNNDALDGGVVFENYGSLHFINATGESTRMSDADVSNFNELYRTHGYMLTNDEAAEAIAAAERVVGNEAKVSPGLTM